MSAADAQAAMPQPPGSTVVDYCRNQGFPFEPDLIARYLAAMLTKPLVILAGISGTGKSKLAELVAEFYSREVGPNTRSPLRRPVVLLFMFHRTAIPIPHVSLWLRFALTGSTTNPFLDS
jgi:hypothetical protein